MMNARLTCLTLMLSANLLTFAPITLADDDGFAPGGTALDHHTEQFPNLKVVMDLKARIPADVTFGVITVKRIIAQPNAKLVVVIEGPAVAMFAKKNYLSHQGTVDDWADLADKGVQVEYCGNSLHGAGLQPQDMIGLSVKHPAVVDPGALSSIAHYEQMGYMLVQPSAQEEPTL